MDTIVSKLFSSIEEVSWPTTVNSTRDQIKNTISESFAPYLKGRISAAKESTAGVLSMSSMLNSWSSATSVMIIVLPVDALFPLIDMWRLTFLDPAACSWASSASASACGGFIQVIASRALDVLGTWENIKGPRNYVLTVLRLMCNLFSSVVLTRRILTDETLRGILTGVMVESLVSEDGSVRTAASGIAFNMAAWLQNGRAKEMEGERNEEWEVEMISAVVEALGREKSNEQVGG